MTNTELPQLHKTEPRFFYGYIVVVAIFFTLMLTFGLLEEDLAVVGQPLAKKERQTLYRYVLENSEDYCHLCGRCQKTCPSRVQTTSILHCLVYHESYGKINLARESYSRLKPAQTALSCQNCAECEKVCPYGVAIRKRIREAQSLLA